MCEIRTKENGRLASETMTENTSSSSIKALSREEVEELGKYFEEYENACYHEAGHSVAEHFSGFRPTRITFGPDAHARNGFALAEHDGRTSSFLNGREAVVSPSPRVQQRLHDLAVCTLCGVAAESKHSGIPVAELRDTSGKGDYDIVRQMATRFQFAHGFEYSDQVYNAYISLWEARAAALMEHPQAWSAVESLASLLDQECGELDRYGIEAAIEWGVNANAKRTA